MESQTRIGRYVQNRRKALDMSIRDVAVAVGGEISHTEIYRIENGQRKKPGIKVLKMFAKALSVDFMELMEVAGYLDDEESPPINSRGDLVKNVQTAVTHLHICSDIAPRLTEGIDVEIRHSIHYALQILQHAANCIMWDDVRKFTPPEQMKPRPVLFEGRAGNG